MLLKCCTQYVNKFGKLSSGHKTGKSQFSFQSQRRAISKTVQTTIQLCSFHMLVRLCSKSFKLGFNSTGTENFQMYRLGLKEAEEWKIKFLPPLDHRKDKRIPEEKKKSASLTIPAFDCVDHSKLWKILKRDGNIRLLYLPPEKLVCWSRSDN